MGKFSLCVAVTAIAVSGTVSAAEWCIPSPKVVGNEAAVIALTNALLSCGDYDTVTLSNGVYDLTGVYSEVNDATYGTSHLKTPANNLVILRGDPSFDREEVVLKGDGTARILRFGQVRSWVKNITFTNSYSTKTGGAIVAPATQLGQSCYITNCVFRGNRSKVDSGVVYGATMYNCLAEANRAADVAGVLRYGKAYDCAISNNYAYMGGAGYQVEFVRCHVAGNMSNKEGGALKYASHARNCVFTDNCSTNGNGGAMDCQDGGSAYNCRFIRNWSEVQGGAIAGLRGVVSNCYFESNYARRGSSNGAIAGNATYVANNKVLDSVFTNNASGWGNAVGSSVSIWSNCTFVSNHVRSPAGGNAGPGGGSYYNCTFRDPWCASDANQSKPATNNYARILRWDRMVAVSGGKLYDCTVEGPVSGCTLTRCTLANVTNVAIVVNKSTLTNCLVVGNRVVSDNSQASQSVFAGDAGREIVNSTVVKNRGLLFNAVGTNVVNTLFADNVLANGTTSADISVGGSYAAVPVFDHCLYKTKSDTKGVYKACIQLGATETPKFNRGKHAGYPYYMTKRSSKAVDAGATVDWPEGAVDRGGYPRVTGSAVDIGCYESCLPVPGGLLLLR